MSNKQVIAIFIIGIALLLGAFWAGLYVVKQDTTPAGQANAANQNSPSGQAAKQAPANANSQATNTQASGENARYVVRVAAFGTMEKAKELEAKLRVKYLATHVKEPSAQDPLYRVNIGPYDKRDADKVAAELSTEYKGIMILPWTQN